jgi:hypothetical protein
MDELATQGVVPQTMAQSMMGGTGQAFGGYTQGGRDDPDSPDFVGQSLAADNYGVMGFSGGDQVGSYGGQSFADSSNAPAGSSSFDDASSGAYGYF